MMKCFPFQFPTDIQNKHLHRNIVPDIDQMPDSFLSPIDGVDLES